MQHNGCLEKGCLLWLLLSKTGGAPYDGKARDRTNTDHHALDSVYSIAAIAGIVYAVACFVFNTVFRNKRYFLNQLRQSINILLHIKSG